MLVLTRRPGESIVVDGSIVVTVVQVQGNRVRIGIQAPAHISIHRQELHAKLAQEAAVQHEAQASNS